MGSQLIDIIALMKDAHLIFWDFDGVIKDSVEVKSRAYEELFSRWGAEFSGRVRHHHDANGGISRLEKIPLYLSWLGITATDEIIDELTKQFSNLVLESVLHSPWIPGAYEYLAKNHKSQLFVLVTATPEEEIKIILQQLEIEKFFFRVYGAPTKKSDAIKETLCDLNFSTASVLMIGDSESDLQAAYENSVPFLLRCTNANHALKKCHQGLKIGDFHNG